MVEKISREAAEQEVNDLLDFRDVTQKDRESKPEETEIIIDGLMKGIIVIKDDKSVEQALKYPIGKGPESVSVLVYKPRFSVDTFQIASQGIKPTDFIGLQAAQISALTNVNRNIIRKMDWKDWKTASAIAGFF